ncbi:MAG: hypothetical protein M3314_09975 [Actinomycetota bacterium]|nr:hypothetical protein [Actinomycetota bacterium]
MRRATLVVFMSAALTGVSGLVLPAYGQSAGVGNTGQGSAGTGGNSSVGNASGNAAATQSSATAPEDEGLLGLGGLLNAPVNLSLGPGPSNTSNGTSAVNSGPASATGNTTTNGVTQAGGGGAVAPIFGPVVPAQSAGIGNSGSAAADTGGNRSVGNDSDNAATITQNAAGGLINLPVNVNLLGGPSNVSNGTSTINTGAAEATGNEAVNSVDQVRTGALFGPGVCDGWWNLQNAEVQNSGAARADTGGNASVGNQSSNVAAITQDAGGGLINLPLNLNLLGGVANASDGQSAITTGAANATGNQATTGVTQQCLEPELVSVDGPHFKPHLRGVDGHKVHHGPHHKGAPKQELAHTGVDPFVMGLVAFTLLFGGFLFLVWERVEALPARRTPAA